MIYLMEADESRRNYERELNEKFQGMVKRGEDVRQFLYAPQELLTPEIKEYMDEYLDDMAFRLAFTDVNGFAPGEKMTVYMDEEQTLFLDTQEGKIETLKRLLVHFEKKEAYENCKQIKETIEFITTTLTNN